MTYGLISDIHGNLEALDAVLSELKDVDAFLCLGDIVGYGPDPVACLDRVRGLPHLVCVVGNHDLAATDGENLDWFNPFARAAIEWTAEQLSPQDKQYLRSLPLTAHVDTAILVHGSLLDPEKMNYITSPAEARLCFDAMPGDLTFIGHTHITEYYRARKRARLPDQVPLWPGGDIPLDDRLRYIINPGAVGQPRDGNPAASFATWDLDTRTITIRRTPYDIPRVQDKMRKAVLPEYLSDRLSIGR
jgi:diadenosine tetraphosphatase ApaH/serine/threonine PP2A family protein phosphatase